jgi:hypothetical protein
MLLIYIKWYVKANIIKKRGKKMIYKYDYDFGPDFNYDIREPINLEYIQGIEGNTNWIDVFLNN